MNNYEKIKAMSIDEMAKCIDDISDCICRICKNNCSAKCKSFETCCEGIKKWLESLQEENEKLKESADEAKIEYENLLLNRNDFAERAEKYKQALEEIRKPATRLRNNNYDSMQEVDNDINFIVDKINEVLK